MIINRRKMLSLLGMAPSAARIAADQAQMQLTNPDFMAAGGVSDSKYDANDRAQVPPARVKLGPLDLVKYLGRIEGELKNEARFFDGFDADLLSLVSVSFSRKVQIQRNRTYLHKKELRRRGFLKTIAKRGFYEVNAEDNYIEPL